MQVSIYLTTYNRKELLERAINSVLNQSYKNIELLVVDDCSSDGTKDFLEAQYEKYNAQIPFRFFINKKNKGACFSRNVAIKEATGEFITGLDDDDYFLPERIAKFVDSWGKKNVNTICLFSNFRAVSNYGISESKRNHLIMQSDLLYSNHIGNQVFTRTENLIAINGFDETMPAWQDLECWYRLLEGSTAECITGITYVMDVSHPNERISLANIDKIVAASNIMKIKHKYNSREKNRLNNQLIRYKFNLFLYLKCFLGFVIALDGKGLIKLHLCSFHSIRRLLGRV